MEDRCVCCGEIIPEGNMTCVNCLEKWNKVFSNIIIFGESYNRYEYIHSNRNDQLKEILKKDKGDKE